MNKPAQLRKPLPDSCYIKSSTMADSEVFERELDKVFGHVWIQQGHVCEARSPGQLFSGEIGGVPLLIIRGSDGTLRAFEDTCGQCGESVALAQWGTRSELSCLKRHVLYDIDGLAKGDRPGLVAVHIDISLRGMVFCALDPYEPLKEDLGPLWDWWWEMIKPDVEWELINVYGFPSDANYKAFTQPGDGYHVQQLHRIFSKSMLPKDGFYDKQSSRVSATHGHCCFSYPPPDYDRFRKDVWPDVYAPDEIDILQLCNLGEGVGGYIGNNFPNVLWATFNGWSWFLQTVQPRSSERSYVNNKIYAHAGLDDIKKRAVLSEVEIWGGPMGLNGQDDSVNFDWQQKALRGGTVKELVVARRLGETPDQREVEAPPDSELGYRSYYRRWQRYMDR